MHVQAMARDEGLDQGLFEASYGEEQKRHLRRGHRGAELVEGHRAADEDAHHEPEVGDDGAERGDCGDDQRVVDAERDQSEEGRG